MNSPKPMPRVSVIIPTFNREQFVVEAVESVLRQTFRDFELIVVDDGSTDNTRDVLARYGKRIRYVRQDNAGVSAARNRGIRLASGEWIAFLDSDDEWQPEYLAAQMKRAREYPGAVAHITNAVHVFPDGEKGSHFAGIGVLDEFKRGAGFLMEKPFQFIIRDGGVYWFLQTCLMRRDVLLRAGLLNEEYSLAEDLDLISRMALHGAFSFSPEVHARIWRRNEEIESLLVKLNWGENGYQAFAKMYAGLLEREDLSFREQRAVARVLGNNRRALGNLRVRLGDRKAARKCFAESLCAYPTLRGLVKYCATFLPAGLALLFVSKENGARHKAPVGR